MDDVKAGLERYRQAMVEDWEEGVRLGHPFVSRLSKAVISTRHFARSGALPAWVLDSSGRPHGGAARGVGRDARQGREGVDTCVSPRVPAPLGSQAGRAGSAASRTS